MDCNSDPDSSSSDSMSLEDVAEFSNVETMSNSGDSDGNSSQSDDSNQSMSSYHSPSENELHDSSSQTSHAETVHQISSDEEYHDYTSEESRIQPAYDSSDSSSNHSQDEESEEVPIQLGYLSDSSSNHSQDFSREISPHVVIVNNSIFDDSWGVIRNWDEYGRIGQSPEPGIVSDSDSDEGIQVPARSPPLLSSDSEEENIPVVDLTGTQPALPAECENVVNDPSNSFSCAICLQSPKNRHPYSTSCGHIFCKVCIKRALRAKSSCPTCNRNITFRETHPLYFN